MDAPVNPLLDFHGLPRFDAIRAAHVTPAVDALVAQARAAVERVATDPRPATWESVVEPVTETFDHLGRAWGTVAYLNAVVNTPELRDAYNANQPKLVDFYTDMAQDLRLYDRYRALREAPSFATLDASQRRLIDNELRDFKLGGAELSDSEKARLKALNEEMADLSTRFEENVLDATNAWSLFVTREEDLAGIPADVVAAAREAAEAVGEPGWKLTLRMPCYLPVMQYAQNRELRRRLHEGYVTLAIGARREPRVGQRPGHRAHPRAAPRRGAAAGISPTTPRFRWCRRWLRPRPKWRHSCAT